MSDSMDKAVYQAAKDGDEAELRRLIERGGSVNWHNPQVRRRMCLAWARSRPLLSPNTQPARTARLGVGFAAAPPTRGAWHTPPRRTGRAARPRAPNVSSRLTCRFWIVHQQAYDWTALMIAAGNDREGCVRLLLESKANVNATQVSLERDALPQAHLPWTS